MPELPDVTLYVEGMREHIIGQTLRKFRIQSPFVLRTVEPSPATLEGRPVKSVERLGKRIVVFFEDNFYLIIHLMISGRLWWRKPNIAIPKGKGLAVLDFDNGSLLFTEMSKKKRASLHLVQGKGKLVEFDRGGLDLLQTDG